jgi:nickel-dependent lactate racemase
VAPCTEGPGSKEGRTSFRDLAALAPEELMALIRAGKVSASGGAFDYAYSKAVNRYRVTLVSDSYSAAEAEEMGLGYGASLQEAVDQALGRAGPEATVSVMPVGGLTLPLPSP